MDTDNSVMKYCDDLYDWFYKSFGSDLCLQLRDDPNCLTVYDSVWYEITAPKIFRYYKFVGQVYLGEDYPQRRFQDIYDALKKDIEPHARAMLESIDREKMRLANETTVN